TGDNAVIDSNGFISITGRIKEIIVLPSGKNINPEEIENEILSSFPLVKDIGVIDKGGILFAVIQPDFAKVSASGIVNIRETMKWEVIDRYNVKASHHKKIMDFAVIEADLPRTRLGKLRRFALKDCAGGASSVKEEIAEPDYEEYRILRDCAAEMTGRSVSAGDHLELDLNLDSLDRVELQVRIESIFGTKLSNEDLSKYPRLCDLAEHIREKKTRIEDEKINWKEILSRASSRAMPKGNYLMGFSLLFLKPFFKSYIRIKPEGISSIPDGPVIFAPNHQSHLDGILLSALLKRRMRNRTFFFAKDRNFNSALRRFFAARANIVLLNINKDLKDSILQMGTIAREGNNIVVFPEGARSRNGSIQPFKKTFAILSRELGIPVVPVAIDGAFSLFSIGSRIPRSGTIRMTFLPPVYPLEKEYSVIVEETCGAIAAAIEKEKSGRG
ncbi:MAG: 1-acyl-sn-glycerol-3-phosphate acyltransferase, partial [Spirochaetota bacterium]